MDDDIKKSYCPNCGTPLTEGTCSYCGEKTGIKTKDIDIEYPVIECKEASINFINFYFPLMFGSCFVFSAIVINLIFVYSGIDFLSTVLIFCALLIPGIVLFVIAFIKLARYKKVLKRGKEIEATVYRYMKETMWDNDMKVKLLIDTEQGKKFILYKLDDNTVYEVNSKIKLITYKDLFLIKKDE
jgi:hypothetical protein